ncbi:hypothetical protein TrST_g7993 [Triparma strigata]|uniref:DOMON domain-containing protein n=1 Tax=Triparma strigata TaxID=1606541 RepID=A0A9W7AB17_9STRA|nr:hypothetical protein TrST_g7993 [Triparma strigata]
MAFSLPETFLGIWEGTPTFSMLGPWTQQDKPFQFSISQIPTSLDYIFENELNFEGVDMGWQRFYVAANDNSTTDNGILAGDLHYCGWLDDFTATSQLTGANPPRYNRFNLESQTESSVTFCYDSDDIGAFEMDINRFVHLNMNPFMSGCSRCDCANWTITHNEETDTLTSLLQMSGGEGHTHSKHLLVELARAGPPPVHDESLVYGSGCDFSGKDSQPVNPVNDVDVVEAKRSSTGCPFLSQRSKAQKSQLKQASSPPPSHCYVINKATDYHLSWTLDETSSVLNITVSAPAESASTWVAIGFRPKGRSYDESYTEKLSSKHTNFGMQGADIVAGSVSNGVRTLYAELYTGPPIASTDLEISEESVNVINQRVELSFSRPVLSGNLFKVYKDNDASIISSDSDIIWAIGSDDDAGSCSYHDENRGYRFIDWQDPESHLDDSMKC